MSTQLHDLANALANASSVPAAVTTTANGSAIDLMLAEGGNISAILSVGAVSGTSPTLAVKFQESDDGTTGWVDMDDSTFTTVTAANNLQVRSFQRTKRYIRHVLTLGGTTPSFTLSLTTLAQRKMV